MFQPPVTEDMSNVTVNQFIGLATNKYRRRYNKLVCQSPYDYPDFINGLPCQDHGFFVGPYVISRPYSLHKEAFREFIEWCDKYNLDFTTHGVSSWHPATIIIVVYRNAWVDEFKDAAKKYGDAFETGVYHALYKRIHGQLYRIYRPDSSRWGKRETGVFIIDTRGKHGIGDASVPLNGMVAITHPFFMEYEI